MHVRARHSFTVTNTRRIPIDNAAEPAESTEFRSLSRLFGASAGELESTAQLRDGARLQQRKPQTNESSTAPTIMPAHTAATLQRHATHGSKSASVKSD